MNMKQQITDVSQALSVAEELLHQKARILGRVGRDGWRTTLEQELRTALASLGVPDAEVEQELNAAQADPDPIMTLETMVAQLRVLLVTNQMGGLGLDLALAGAL